MIYTFGQATSYYRLIKEGERLKGGPVLKKGREGDYAGGTVFKTFEEAKSYINDRPEYHVFGVQADWEKDTEPNRNGYPFHDLLISSPIVILDQKTGEIYA